MEENYKQLCALKTPFIELMLLGNVQLDGVLFNHVAKGGIVVKDLAEVSAWKNVMWGSDNQAPAAELVKQWDGQSQSLFQNNKDF